MYSYGLQTFKDAMHAYDHGVSMYIIEAIICTLHRLESRPGLAKNTLVIKLTARMHNLCSSVEVKHTTLMSFVNQSIVLCMETYTTPNKKGEIKCPIVMQVMSND